MKKWILAAMIVACTAGQAPAQSGSYMECTACQLVLGLVDASAGDGQNIAVDASKQCALLPPGDRAACEKFYAEMGPKFIKALKARRAKGESLESICRAMAYCQ
ncbi:saposin domain-containing protein [Fundidesulfovibrio terrae]|uniref:saposin domain-containing protein n=1 Tax=Fundidesulfovibrio terrae TaxID=2922866 RepID=UPI001FAF0F74|nr:saposin domain-containing protein [Fundidesulfovibrio terrae]